MPSLYEEKPWVHSYPSGVPAEVEVPLKSVGKAFDIATERWGKRTAIIFYGKKISYMELRDKVDRLASALYDLGIKKGDRVAILLLNSPEHIIAFYAIIKIGAISTPISPVYVYSEIRHQLQDSGAETIICQDILYEGVDKSGVNLRNVILSNISESLPKGKRFLGKSVLRGVYQNMATPSPEIYKREGVHQLQELIRRYPPNPPRIEIDPDEDLLTLPYTSGTTGLPKGVMITHRNVMADFTQFHAFYPFFEEGREVNVAYMPFYHAGGQFSALLDGILRGSTLVVITTPDVDDILHGIVKYKASWFIGAPAIYEALKDYKKTDIVEWKKLKIVASGADALHEFTARDWKDRTGVDLHDNYGMTELVAMSHGTPLRGGRTGSIGIPIPNTMAAILDPEEDLFISPGEMGELVISGPQVTKGYWNKPEATKDCEAMINSVRWWRTGDLARMGEDGYFYIYDRKRDLIKYKGLRVYAREVEEALKTHPNIKEVGVIGIKDIKVGENVKALVVLESDARGKISEEDIIEYCRGKLAHYKIPRIVEFVGEIPKTDIGKVSRRELREEEI
ncbi:MAG: AMP-binding protein [Deltaproteobacteria bacterium]|nr:AMP-binding protein [Deltaproteobacteria bacterium]